MAAEFPPPLTVSVGGASGASPSSAPSPAYRKPEDSFRDEIARVIFGDIGSIRDDYSCAVESKILLHGRMYITDKFICFYSNFFGFEKKIKIPFSHVLKITKGNTALLIPNSINIVTSRKEYCFRSFWDREETYYQMAVAFRAYRRLPSAPRDAILDSRSLDKDGNFETPQPSSSPFSSTSGGNLSVAAAADAAATPSAPARPSTPSAASSAAAAAAAASAPATPPRRATFPTDQERATAAAAAMAAAISASVTTTTDGGQPPAAEGGDSGSVSSYDEDDMLDFDDLREGAMNQVSVDLGEAFARAVREEPPLKEKGLDFRLRRPVTVQEFFEEFVSDRAPLGVDKYHEANGDKELDISPWQEVNQGVGATRSVRFVAPLEGLPVGPPTAPVFQLQRVRVFGRHGMILETSSTMENVPAADCFTLEDRWVIAPANPERPEEGGLVVRTAFEVRFNKSTFFRKIIEGRSRGDTLQYHQRYFEMVEKHLARKHPQRERAPSRGPGGHHARPGTPGAVRVEKGPTGAEVGDRGAVGGAVEEVLSLLYGAACRIKWDRFVVAVLVFTLFFLCVRLLLGALLPLSATTTGGGGGGGPSAQQWGALLAELKALRSEVQGLRSEVRGLSERLARGG